MAIFYMPTVTLTLLAQTVSETIEFFYEEQDAGHDEPFPEVGSVQDQHHPVDDVEQVCPVEYLAEE